METPLPTPEKVEKPEVIAKPRKKSKSKAPASEALGKNVDDVGLFEFEESESPLIPLYHLRDEGTFKWVLLSDLCYVLKVKSKDTLLKQVKLNIPIHRHAFH